MKRFILIILFLSVAHLPSESQNIIYVTGTIYDKLTKKPVNVSNIEVEIYAYNTVAAALEQKQLMENSEFTEVVVSPDYTGVVDRNGYYMVNVASTGAILYKIGIGNDIILEEVNDRLTIDVYAIVENYLQAAVASADRLEIGALEPQSDIEGNYLYLMTPYSIPSNTAKSNVRLILQPILFYADTKDTIRYLKPQVIDGAEYSINLLRKMDFHPENDKLYRYVDKEHPLTSEKQTFVWSDSVYVEDPMRNYTVTGCFQFEDYSRILKYTEQPISSMRPRRPTRFLKIDVAPFVLNPDDYPESPKRERFTTEKEISILFDINKATFDMTDSITVKSLENLRKTLLDVIGEEGSKLKEFHIACVASPDGNYEKNVSLAGRRMDNAILAIRSYLPKKTGESVYWVSSSRVAGWEEVAVLLEKDGKDHEAAVIRDIVSQYPKDQTIQSRKIRNLPEYRSVIVDYLPGLRSVRYSYTQEIYRNPTGEEILRKYQNDPGFRNGDKRLTTYEYWKLFQMVEDPAELDSLYRMANRVHMEITGKPWIIPSNALAASAIRRGEVDTTLLAPFVNYTVSNTDVRIKRSFGDEIINPEPVVANQMIMYLNARNFMQASRLSRILKDSDTNAVLKSYAMALGGYYKGGKTPEEMAEAQKVFHTIEKTSPFNKVVINLAMRLKTNDKIAEKTMPECEAAAETTYEKALIQYLWAIIYQRKFMSRNDILSDMERQERLIECFKIDPSFIEIAESDGYIDHDIFQAARDMYLIQR